MIYANKSYELLKKLKLEATRIAKREPFLSNILQKTILNDSVNDFEDAIAITIAYRLVKSSSDIEKESIRSIIRQSLDSSYLELGSTMTEAVQADILTVLKRDPACGTLLEVVLFFKGFAALVCHRVAKRNWVKSRFVSLWFQSQASENFGVDIHPDATIGKEIMIDHATGVVIGETAVIEDGCTLLHGVTLGGTGKEIGDRHPKIGKNVLIGAGTSILGNIIVGDGAKIGAGSVVIKPIPNGATAVGSPAKVIGWAKEARPGSEVDNSLRNIQKNEKQELSKNESDGTISTTGTQSISSSVSSSSNEKVKLVQDHLEKEKKTPEHTSCSSRDGNSSQQDSPKQRISQKLFNSSKMNFVCQSYASKQRCNKLDSSRPFTFSLVPLVPVCQKN